MKSWKLPCADGIPIILRTGCPHGSFFHVAVSLCRFLVSAINLGVKLPHEKNPFGLLGALWFGSDRIRLHRRLWLHPAPLAPSDIHGSYKTALPATSKDEFILCDILLFGYLDFANKIPSPCKNAQSFKKNLSHEKGNFDCSCRWGARHDILRDKVF